MSRPRSFIGLDVGGTRIKAQAYSSAGKLLAQEGEDTADDGSRSWLERARTTVNRVLERVPTPVAIGVAAPGLAAPDGRSIRTMPGRLAGLEGLDWKKWLGSAGPVPVFNDAHAALLGECWIGAAREATNVMLLTLGTGVGGAAMVDGRILRGHIGRAGHFGHVSLDPSGAPDIVNAPGSLEDKVGECSLAARSDGSFATTRELVAAYRRGSREASRVWLESVQSLAAAVAGLVNVLDPEIVVIGGGIADAGEALFGPLRKQMNRFEWRPGGARVRIVKAKLGGAAGAAGAARGAMLARLP
jgi:glucokinase